jgi:nucleoside-diphosphate-sugar epimerase
VSLFLVTGGAGFVGSNIVEELLNRGERVRVLDNLSTGKRHNLAFVERLQRPEPAFEFMEGDIRHLDTCRRACHGVDNVLHQAALCSVPRSINDPLASNDVNVCGTLTVLMAAREAGVKRVVHASSSSVYGSSEVLPKTESQAPSPVSPYAVSKLAGEYYCQVFTKVFGLETVILRYFNVFGPRQDPSSQYAAVVPRFIQLALDGKPLEIHGDGLQSRDFTYISNVVEANLQAAEAPDAVGHVINIACGQTSSVLQIADAIAGALGKKLEYHHTPARTGDVRHSLADISKAQRLLGYETHVGVFDGLRNTVAYFQNVRARRG